MKTFRKICKHHIRYYGLLPTHNYDFSLLKGTLWLPNSTVFAYEIKALGRNNYNRYIQKEYEQCAFQWMSKKTLPSYFRRSSNALGTRLCLQRTNKHFFWKLKGRFIYFFFFIVKHKIADIVMSVFGILIAYCIERVLKDILCVYTL